ncbi:MAG: DUF350 domain-containing protein [Alphaproteobacteria bacterium]|jgi:putative membrane protein
MDFSVAASIGGLPEFLAYLAAATVLTVAYAMLYGMVTPHNELALIRNNNAAAGVAFAGSLIGFVVPLSSAIENSDSIGDCVIWGIVALIVQIVAYFILRIPVNNLSARIEEGQMGAGLWLGAGSLAAGIVNAACMSY